MREFIGQILVAKEYLTEDQLEIALSQQKSEKSSERVGELLVAQELVTEEQILECLSEQFNLPWTPKIDELEIDSAIIAKIPIDFAKKHQFCPCYQAGDELILALNDPLKVHLFDDLRQLLGLNIKPVLTKTSEIELAINECYGSQKDLASQAIKDIEDADYAISLDDLGGAEDLLDMANKAPVIKFVNSIIYHAVNDRASDIHIEPYETLIKIRNRIDGVMYDQPSPPKVVQNAIVSRIKIMSGLDIAETRLPQDGRLKISLGDKVVDLRISVLPTSHGERIVMRLLDTNVDLLNVENLGFPKRVLKEFHAEYTKPNGIVLVTGPTGSGKSTTLYSVLNTIKSKEKNIITIEDPVEYQLEGVSQIQVKSKIGFTFSAGLRSILRQDPDVVMVGEIRDSETASIAIQASQTGHLVFSTLHTNDTTGAITRLINMKIEPYLISSSLIAVLAQRLVRVNCEHCKEAYIPDTLSLETLNINPKREFLKGKGCMRCNHMGYKGRQGIFEFLAIDDGVRDLIGQRASSTEIKNDYFLKRKKGLLLRDDGIAQVIRGQTTLSEVLRVS
ncbi:MAG: Flp pilus assembly complex ATPase component TadA [Candidatus Cloacimonetes bacterium]|nr:Flp pilus assembly complex ATPase component TadA [Candidatus Cloacimonadota bacterium]